MTTPIDAPPRGTCRICRHMSPEPNCPIHDRHTDDTHIDRAIHAVLQPNSTLDALTYLLRILSDVDAADIAATPMQQVGRLQTMCWLVARQLTERWDAETRSAPPAALAEVVRDAAVPCGYSLCSQRVLPWQHDGVHCDADCVNGSLREHGEWAFG